MKRSQRKHLYKEVLKPSFDFIFALFLLVLLALPLLVLALFCKLQFKAAFFTQNRVGKDEKIFKIYKLKTMFDDGRLSGYGKLLRSLSLDELPQLVNILKGQMSFIGPRPLLQEYLPLYTKTQIRRHEVLPGLSGLAQLKGRNSLSWEERFRLDLAYVRRLSFCLDLLIFLKTILKLFSKGGVKEASFVSEKFKGKHE